MYDVTASYRLEHYGSNRGLLGRGRKVVINTNVVTWTLPISDY